MRHLTRCNREQNKNLQSQEYLTDPCSLKDRTTENQLLKRIRTIEKSQQKLANNKTGCDQANSNDNEKG